MLNFRTNGQRRLGRPLKRQSHETATGLLRLNWWRIVVMMMMTMMIKYKDRINKTSYGRVTQHWGAIK